MRRMLSIAAQMMGRKGGSRNSPAQLAVKAANGKLGGRPRRYRFVNGVLERKQSNGAWKEVPEPFTPAVKAYLRRHKRESAITEIRTESPEDTTP